MFSWRVPFVSCIVLGLITLYMIHRWVPDVEALPNNGMKAQFHFLRNKAPWLIIAATFLGNGGILCWFSYISPLLQMEGGFSAASISLLMILAGGGMVVGNQVSALLADRFKPGRFTCYLQFLAAAALLLTFFLAPFGWVSVVLMFICCACLFGIGSPEQFLIVKHAKGGEMLGGCCIQGAFNLGNAMGAFLGGIPVAMGLGYNFPALIGVPMALAGAICLLIFHKKYE
jgi:DHA1 family arabinose polymer transporter-like MFS transporter